MISEERRKELDEKFKRGEIDIYDYNDEIHDYFDGIEWTCALYDDDGTDVPNTHDRNEELENEPKFFLVKIRISNGRTYQVAKITAIRLDHRLCRWFGWTPPGHFSVPPIGGV